MLTASSAAIVCVCISKRRLLFVPLLLSVTPTLLHSPRIEPFSTDLTINLLSAQFRWVSGFIFPLVLKRVLQKARAASPRMRGNCALRRAESAPRRWSRQAGRTYCRQRASTECQKGRPGCARANHHSCSSQGPDRIARLLSIHRLKCGPQVSCLRARSGAVPYPEGAPESSSLL
jgi:hypothetical protein